MTMVVAVPRGGLEQRPPGNHADHVTFPGYLVPAEIPRERVTCYLF